jgi:hypothetical protein
MTTRSVLALVLATALPALAQQPPPPAPAPEMGPQPETVPTPATAPAGAPTESVVASVEPTHPDRGAFVVGLKLGGLFSEPFGNGDPYTKLGAWGFFSVEAGYILPYLRRSFGVLLDVSYSQPSASITVGSPPSNLPPDPRVDANGGAYTRELTQRQLTFGLTALYRATFINDRFAPYIGIGPRLWLLQTSINGSAGAMNPINESTEQSTRVGLSVPIGFDFQIGPGRIFGELQIFWAPIEHRTTGDSSVGALTLDAGYRLFL